MSLFYKPSLSDFSVGAIMESLNNLFDDFRLFSDVDFNIDVELDLDQADIDSDLGYERKENH